MSWTDVYLGEFTNTLKGYAFKSEWFTNSKIDIPIVKVKDFTADSISIEDVDYLISSIANEYQKYSLKSGDVLIQTVGSWASNPNSVVGKVVKVPSLLENGLLNQNAVKLIFNDRVDSVFVFYKLKSDEFKNYIINTAQGAASQASITLDSIKSYKFNIPPLETQKQIASILSAYDDLIENNLKRIKLLEETAQNIYKEWFVNFSFPNYENTPINQETGLPEGWEKDIIGNQLLTIKRNGKLKTDHYEKEGRFPIIDQGNGYIAGYTNNEEIVQNQQLPIVIFGDHTRRVKFVNFPFVSGADGTQLMFPKNEKMLPAYFYLSIKNIDLSNYAYARHFKFMKEQIILIPNEKTLKDFNNMVYPLLEQTIKLFNYNQKLKEARDILLPRLMNKTIEV